MDSLFEPLAMNAKISAAKAFSPMGKEKVPAEIKILKQMTYADHLDYLAWFRSEAILALIFSLIGVACVGPARAVGYFVFYNQNHLELIRDAPGNTYQVYDKTKYLPIPFETQAGMVWLVFHLLFGMSLAGSLLFAMIMGLGIIWPLIAAPVVYIFVFLPVILFHDGICRIFEKAKKPGLSCLLPVYKTYVLTEVANVPIYIFLVIELVPVVNMGAWIYLNIKLAERFGKPVTFGLAMAFAPFIFYPILGRSGDRAFRLETDPPPEFDEDL